jgi:hypothetical protein
MALRRSQIRLRVAGRKTSWRPSAPSAQEILDSTEKK